ncbi:accessory factor UbiK family protein [Thermaurantiacus tibetensis]|uniref:accessory factor UbiK family protein n=1 Tax=Thermaurantiacus tibetensis TaxID=2759035 RepID=UPI00188EE261|nr:accessory factor UbiK family protein [Thermaurantiacus tibetensis]
MQKENQLFEDFARLLSSLAGTMAGAGREAEARMRERLRAFVDGPDAVSREEFEAVKELAAATRAEVERLKAEIAALRAQNDADGRSPAG